MDMMLKTISSKYTANVRNVTDLCLGLKKNLRLARGYLFLRLSKSNGYCLQSVMVTI